jgi:predicted thioesterase
MPLEPGQAATVERVVTRELTADALGNPGVTVLATPFVITLLEHAAHAVMVPHLGPGAATGGTGVEIRHLVAEGRHERFMVPDLTRFLARTAAKATRRAR